MMKNNYDTDVTTWSPQGRLFQAEYAMEAVKQGSACVGARSDTHVVLAALKRSPGELASYQQKVFRIDDHIGVVLSGLTSDGRSLCRYMRGEALNHKYVFGSPLQATRLVGDVADKHQRATWSYVRRPYGVGLLVAAYDRTGPHLLQTAPDGNFYEWHAMALGARSQSAKTALERTYKTFGGLSRDELLRAAVRALNTCTEADKELTLDNCVLAVVGKDEPFRLLQGAEVAPFLVGLEAPARAPAAAAERESAERMPVEGEDATSAASFAPPSTGAGGGGGGMDVI